MTCTTPPTLTRLYARPTITIALAAACVLALAPAPHIASAQVIESGYPASVLYVDNGALGNAFWTGWAPGGTGYGSGFNNQGASGYISHAFDFASNLTAIRVDVNELRNTGGPFIATNSPYAGIRGQVVFTPQVSMAYTISGSVYMNLAGASTSNSTTTGSVIFEQISGPPSPALATYTGGVFRSGLGGFGAAGTIFDAATPASGSSTGFLAAGATYRMQWDLRVLSAMNNDATLSADVGTPPGGSFFQIGFAVPSPSGAALLAMGGLMAAPRRRGNVAKR